jgi:hypothetical protein
LGKRSQKHPDCELSEAILDITKKLYGDCGKKHHSPLFLSIRSLNAKALAIFSQFLPKKAFLPTIRRKKKGKNHVYHL